MKKKHHNIIDYHLCTLCIKLHIIITRVFYLSTVFSNAAFNADLPTLFMDNVAPERCHLIDSDIYSRQKVPGAIPDLRPSLNTAQPTSLITG